MAYAFMSIEKIKTRGAMVSKYNHNCRKAEVENAIPELARLNEDLIPLPKASGKTLNYREAFQKRIDELPYYENHKIRSDQNLGFEVLLTYSRDEGIDTEKWKEKSVQWLKSTFNVAGDGKDNVVHAVYHGDEVGNPHIHAFVIPVDERGHLNAKRFTNGSRVMSELQTSYAKSVEELGLKRGLAGSSARHRDIRKMYASLNNAMNIPDPKPGETADRYKDRILEHAQTLYASGMRTVDDYEVQRRREADAYFLRQKQAIDEEARELKLTAGREAKTLKKEVKELSDRKQELESAADSYQDQLGDLARQLYDLKAQIQNEEEAKAALKFRKKLEEGINLMKESQPERAQNLDDEIDHAVELAERAEQLRRSWQEPESE